MRRSALLIAATVLAGGLLAGCDLPGGSPQVLGPDRVPNDSFDANLPLVSVPTIITGSIDAKDVIDYFLLKNPDQSAEVTINCPPGTGGAIELNGEGIANCDPGASSASAVVGPEGRITASVEEPMGGTAFVPYVLTVRYSPVQQ